LANQIVDAAGEDGPTAEEDARAAELGRAAVVDIEQAITLGLRHADVYEALFFTKNDLQDDAGALVAINAALAAGPPTGWLHYVHRRKMGDTAGAREDVRAALALGYEPRDDKEREALERYARGPGPEEARSDAEETPQPGRAERVERVEPGEE